MMPTMIPFVAWLLTRKTVKKKKKIVFICLVWLVLLCGDYTKERGGTPSLKIASTTRCNRVVIALPVLPHTGTVT